MKDEKNPILNPQAEGSNAAGGSKNKGKERANEGGSNFSSSRTIIRSKNSEQLTTLQSQLNHFKTSEITNEKINRKTYKWVDKVDAKIQREKLSEAWSIIPTLGIHLVRDTNAWWFNTVSEDMPEIVKKLVNTAIDDLENQKGELIGKLGKLSEEVNDRENGLLAEIDKLTLEIAKMENQLDQYKEAEKRLKERQEARIKKGQTLDSKAIVDLKQAKERINELEAEIRGLEEQLEDMTCLRDGAEIRVNEWKGKTELKQQELDNAIKSLETLNQRVEEARRERDGAQRELNTLKNVKLKNKKDKISNLEGKVNNLEKELKKHEPSMLYQVADRLGIIQLKNSISNVLIIAGAVVVLYAISWMWKYLVKPTYRNFKGEDENEPQTRRKEKVRYEDYEEIVETKEKPQSLSEKQPTIIINNSTPTEKEPNQSAAISKEEILTQISSEKTDPIIEEKTEKEKPAKKSKKRKNDNGKKKGKK